MVADINPYILSEDNLTAEAKRLIALIETQSPFVFLTGKAGTGKTTLLRYVYKRYIETSVKLAPTGIAALNIEGQTIHKFFKFPPRMFDLGEIAARKPNDVVGKLKLIIIDEISMVRADLLDNVDKILKIWRKTEEPFGGVQILAVGDLFQLPPVLRRGDETDIYKRRYQSTWFFNANIFKDVKIVGVNLKETYRQKDEKFVGVLDNLRIGRELEDVVDWLNGRCLKEAFEVSSSVTLTSTNKAADIYNQREFEYIKGTEVTYEGEFDGKFEVGSQSLPAPQQLKLKPGAQVMVTRNQPSAANGTICRVVDLTAKKIQLERIDNGQIFTIGKAKWEQVSYVLDSKKFEIETMILGKYKQFPIVLGWAITIHKSQGLTLDSILLDLGGGAFASGQAYVGLSRCPSVKNIALARPLQVHDAIVDKDAVYFMSQLFK